MNELVEALKKDNIPVLFRQSDLAKTGLKEDKLNILLKEALENEWVDNIYDDIYVLGKGYKKALVCGCVLSQMLVPNSYVSSYYVMSDENWLVDGIVRITCITVGIDADISTKKYGGYLYEDLYGREINAGIYWEENDNGKYRRAKPLRAFCDMLYQRKDQIYDIDNIETILRIPESLLREKLKNEDFDEIQGMFEIDEIEMFLVYLRKRLGL